MSFLTHVDRMSSRYVTFGSFTRLDEVAKWDADTYNQFRGLPIHIRERLTAELSREVQSTRKLIIPPNVYCIKLGEFRLIYRTEGNQLFIMAVGHKSSVYSSNRIGYRG